MSNRERPSLSRAQTWPPARTWSKTSHLHKKIGSPVQKQGTADTADGGTNPSPQPHFSQATLDAFQTSQWLSKMVRACPCHHPRDSVGLREEGYNGNKLSGLSLLSQTSAVKTTPRPNTFQCVTAYSSVSERRGRTTCSSVDRGPSSNSGNPSEPPDKPWGSGCAGSFGIQQEVL